MKYTENYHLPQWDETDRIMRTDFNQMCADMEAGIMDVRSRAEAGDAKVQKTAADALSKVQASSSAAIAKAQTSANNAQETADAALAKAIAAFSAGNRPYVLGSFTGTGEPQKVELGFRPHLLIVWDTATDKQGGMISSIAIADSTYYGSGYCACITSSGLQVEQNLGNNGINRRGGTNWYIAFR